MEAARLNSARAECCMMKFEPSAKAKTREAFRLLRDAGCRNLREMPVWCLLAAKSLDPSPTLLAG